MFGIMNVIYDIYQKSNTETQTCKIEGRLPCEIQEKKELEDRKEAKMKINKILTKNSRVSILMRNINTTVKTDSKSSD